jgi:hypothetical protein
MIRLPLHLAFMLCIVSLILLAGCTTPQGQKTDPWPVPADRYVFIDHHLFRTGEAVGEPCGSGLMIDFPMYSFDRSTGELRGAGTEEVAVNDSLKLVYGSGVSLGGALGGGTSTYLTGVYALPFTKGEVTVVQVTEDGTATLVNGNGTITLAPGGTWTNESVVTETREFPGSSGICTIRITTKETIFNAGILGKAGIVSNA